MPLPDANIRPASRSFPGMLLREIPMHQSAPGRLRRRSIAAFTLLETLVAAFVVLTAMGAIFQVSSRCMGIIRCSQNVAVASSILQERMQQLQGTDWETLTDSDSYKDQVWTDPEDGTTEKVDGLLKSATQAAGATSLNNILESIRVSAYRPVADATAEPAAITATRTSSTAALTSAATNLVDEKT